MVGRIDEVSVKLTVTGALQDETAERCYVRKRLQQVDVTTLRF